jgi:hypothetical protein
MKKVVYKADGMGYNGSKHRQPKRPLFQEKLIAGPHLKRRALQCHVFEFQF